MSAARALTAGETELVRACFGARLDPARVRIVAGHGNHPVAMIALRQNGAIVLGRTIRFRADHYSDDFAAAAPRLKGLFIHEMVHVRQYAELGTIGFLLRYARELVSVGFRQKQLYAYGDTCRYPTSRLEAQASMAGHYCEACLAADEPRRRCLAANLEGSGLYGL
jgi:hypothetical protein